VNVPFASRAAASVALFATGNWRIEFATHVRAYRDRWTTPERDRYTTPERDRYTRPGRDR